MNNLTKQEQRLNNFIDSIKIDITTPKRDETIKEILQYVSTVIQDGSLNKLLRIIKSNFQEYGK